MNKPNPQEMRFNLDQISKHEKKELKKYCESIYTDQFRKYMDWLPKSIYDVTDKDIQNLVAIEGICGVKLVVPFMRLRKSALEIKKRLT